MSKKSPRKFNEYLASGKIEYTLCLEVSEGTRGHECWTDVAILVKGADIKDEDSPSEHHLLIPGDDGHDQRVTRYPVK